jgi:putative thioredoxin
MREAGLANTGERQMAEMLGQTEPPPDATVATTTATFANDVLAESGRRPVLVDFWAPWCEPCKQLTPILEKAVQAAQGKVKLVTMNIDEHPQIAGQLGIRSIPAVIAFQRGQPVDGFMGALPESQVRGFIERLAGPLPEEEDLHAMADAALAAGEPLAALEIFRELHEKDSGDLAALAGLIKTSVAIGELEEAQKLLAQVPATAAQDAAIAAARAAVENATQAADLGDIGELERRVAAEPNDPQARFELAIALNAQGRRDEAADALLTIIKRDRDWNDAAARKQLLQFFEAWGNMDAATVAARRKLSTLLFS